MASETRVGSYLIGEEIGRGGMGVVYRGRHAKLPREVAVKSIAARGWGGDLRHLRQRFEREAFIQSQLDHPGIVKVYDYVVAEQTYYIVMEYVEGRSLAEMLGGEAAGLPVRRALDLFEQILDAVSYAHGFTYRDEAGAAHRGVIHRDLKPANIMVTPGDRIKITDFGIVKLAGADITDTSGAVYGSPRYVSPEQAEGQAVDQRSDIYSLGVIVYEMLTGEPPFGGRAGDRLLSRTEILRAHVAEKPRPPSSLNPQVTPEVERVVCRALEKKPERRFHSAAEMWVALREARGHDAGDAAARVPPSAVRASRGETDAVDDTGRSGVVTGSVARDTYQTQPLEAHVCAACGAEADEGDERCRACGQDLRASPATSSLTRRALEGQRRGRALKIAVAALALVCFTLALIYFALWGGARAPEPSGGEPSAQLSATPPAGAEPAPASGEVAALRASVEVDSSYDGYNAAPLVDGVTDVRRIAAMRYNQGNWVSAEEPAPHWVKLDFARPARVTAVYVYWGFDRDRYMPSRRVELQARRGGQWETVSVLEPGNFYDRAAFEFAPLVADSVRVYQPPQQGPANRPFVMWVREVQAFGSLATEPPTH